MIAKRVATQARNHAEEEAGRIHRATDVLEQAKAFLRREGFTVYSQSVSVAGSELIMVGSVAMTAAQVVEKAESVRERRGRK